jgi:hypothetical protein
MLVDSTDKGTKVSLPSMLFCCTRQTSISSVAEYFCFTKCDAEMIFRDSVDVNVFHLHR